MAIIENENLETSIKKLKMYKNSLDLNYEEIINNLEKLNCDFETENKVEFQNKQEECRKKGKVLNKIQNDNIYVLERSIEIYKETAERVANKFEDII